MIIATNTNVCRNLVLLAPGSGSLRQCGNELWWEGEIRDRICEKCMDARIGRVIAEELERARARAGVGDVVRDGAKVGTYTWVRVD